ncbi:MAG: MBL fold metallo-hydrolase [Candidatus Falkowbacteria bacterium]|nr:MBL fold metallo-hydrolase [Candidatus Falkowbacteria bacterium]
MKKNRQKLFNIIRKTALALAALFGLILLIFAIFGRPNHELELIFLDVGQGDSTLIKTPDGKTILIDGGPDNKVLRGLGKNLPFYKRRINFIILSHYHDDHITGLIEVIKRYRVGTLIYQSKTPDSLLMADLLKIASQYNVELKPLAGQADLSFGIGCDLNLLNPDILGIKKDPNNSLVSRLDCGGQKFLLAGDNPAAAEKALLASGWPLEADVFKASHHGSNTSNGAEFLEKINPRLIVISVGADNRFGHPGSFFLERATALNIPIKRTDIEGDVKIFAK